MLLVLIYVALFYGAVLLIAPKLFLPILIFPPYP